MKRTYILTLLIALDRLAAVIFFNCPDMCVSSLCWVILAATRSGRLIYTQAQVDTATAALNTLGLYRWQFMALHRLAGWLECIQLGHCAASARDEVAQAQRTLTILTGVKR